MSDTKAAKDWKWWRMRDLEREHEALQQAEAERDEWHQFRITVQQQDYQRLRQAEAYIVELEAEVERLGDELLAEKHTHSLTDVSLGTCIAERAKATSERDELGRMLYRAWEATDQKTAYYVWLEELSTLNGSET